MIITCMERQCPYILSGFCTLNPGEMIKHCYLLKKHRSEGGKMTHSIPADVIKEVGRLIRKGERNKEIAEFLGLKQQTVSYYRRTMGAGSPSSILAPKIIADVYKMGNISEVARKWGCTRQHVYNLLHRAEAEDVV